MTYKSGGNIGKKFNNFINSIGNKVNPLGNKRVRKIGHKFGAITNSELLPFTQQVGSEVYDIALDTADTLAGNTGIIKEAGKQLMDNYGKKYMRQPRTAAIRDLANITKQGIREYKKAKDMKEGGSQFAGYVRRLEAEKKITKKSFTQIKHPSEWLKINMRMSQMMSQ
jgi:hypothetical protein